MANFKGIDVSKWQGVIDWKKVKDAGIEFAILRAGYGRSANQKDGKFEANYKGAKEAGVPVGAYHYSYATNPEQGKAEAKYCLSIIKGKTFEYPIVFDIEDKTQSGLSKETISAIIKAFCTELEKAGYYVAVYANKHWLDTKIDNDCKTKYDIWLAQWSSKPTYKGEIAMWQYSDKGKVNGISGNVDMDISYKDYPSIIKEKGLNGYTQTTEKPVQKPTEAPKPTAKPTAYKEPTTNIEKGDTGEGVKWVQSKLNSKGFDCGEVDGIAGDKTDEAIRKFQEANGLTVDGIVGKITRTALNGKCPFKAPTENVQKGDTGEDVKWVQWNLKNKGFDCGNIDGVFGENTDMTVRIFQNDKDLETDGVVGEKTRKKLK